jgi:tetratricopeptide (TPR) repeat protein
MTDQKPDDTQPHRTSPHEAGRTRPNKISDTQPRRVSASKAPRSRLARWIARIPPRWQPLTLLVPFLLALVTLTFLSGVFGWASGRGQERASATAEAREYLLEQYALARAEFDVGQYDLARQRYEYIFSQDPEFEDVAERWLEVMLILGGTATPTQAAAAFSPTPTFDPRPAEELFTQAMGLLITRSWGQAIDTLAALRKSAPDFNTPDVDGMLYLALRNRGVDKILEDGNLEGGLYDFSLAENFGPLDTTAGNYRDWSRLYLIGNSFWFAYPELAIQYYSQVAFAAPGLRDASGFTAFYRYWQSLIHYGDKLAKAEDWCGAALQYQTAMRARSDAAIQPTAQYANEICLLLTASPTFTPTVTITGTIFFFTATPTPTLGGATATPSATSGGDTPTATSTPTPTIPAGTSTFTPTSTATPTP